MAQGYVDVPHATYDEWRNNTIGNEYDLDGSFGCQCWDYASLFWRNVGFAVGFPRTGAGGYAYECWTNSRFVNAGTEFDLVELLVTVKKGDIVVLDQGRFAGDTAGHIAFADEDYHGGSLLTLVGQNQENPSAVYGYKVTADVMDVTKFLGAFRYKGWLNPPTPVVEDKEKRFPWFIIANKRRYMI